VWKAIEIALLIVLPLVWGLGVEYLFRRIRRRDNDREAPPRDDWVI
jgi:cbb3-type cytochrome oxidase subunit 3